MELFGSNIFSRKREVQAPTPATPSSTAEKGLDVKGGSFEERIIRARNPQTALTVSAVYRAVELRAKTIGQMAIQYQAKSLEGGNFVPSMWGPGKRLNYLLQVEPNPIMSAASLWEQVTINRLMHGNGFVYIERDEMGEPARLWLATCAGYDMTTETYNLTYMTDRGPMNQVSVPRCDVLHFPNTFREQNGFWGISTLKYAFDTLSLIKTESRQALEMAAKGGRVKLIIGEERANTPQSTIAGGLFNKDQMNAYADEINDRIYQKDVVALRGLEKVQNISMSAQDMQMIDILGMSQDDVARFYATPRPLLMMDTNSHYTTYTNATMEYLSRTIAPDSREMEDEFFRKLLGLDDFGKRRIHMCEMPLLRMDKETQAKVDKARLESGTATVNELRRGWDMPTVEKGDIVYISTNLAELGSEKLSGAVQPGRPTEEPKNQ
jgi:HK97 family phage portal protein